MTLTKINNLTFVWRGGFETRHLPKTAGMRWDAAKEEIVNDSQANTLLVRPYRSPWDAELRSLISS